ncbi:hypothetical protein JYK00_05825 [Thermosipho ferrireducens]|uniref:Uncharacterized protein n=1 Tax=Thermosipho ferrireducens TaxID=2571116 RepID=A0ABX7S6P2_9BACT|nr:hypothetical protein [Thermosipho ferrireducens]QTA37262.1 hypothetical protein JYK00_05825 [Thermosipho ferrireducens]
MSIGDEKFIVIFAAVVITLLGIFLLIPKEKSLDFNGVVVRKIPGNSIVVEKDLTAGDRIKQLYEKDQLFVFEGTFIANVKQENQAWQQAGNKAREELATFLGAEIKSNSKLTEELGKFFNNSSYSQGVNVVVNNYVASSKIIAKWKIPQGRNIFEYHVLVYYDPEFFENTIQDFIKSEEKREKNIQYSLSEGVRKSLLDYNVFLRYVFEPNFRDFIMYLFTFNDGKFIYFKKLEKQDTDTALFRKIRESVEKESIDVFRLIVKDGKVVYYDSKTKSFNEKFGKEIAKIYANQLIEKVPRFGYGMYNLAFFRINLHRKIYVLVLIKPVR